MTRYTKTTEACTFVVELTAPSADGPGSFRNYSIERDGSEINLLDVPQQILKRQAQYDSRLAQTLADGFVLAEQ